MPKARFLKMSVAKRETLLRTAAENFSAEGYQAASLNALLRSLDMSKGTFYHAFHDKGDLYAAVLAHYAQRMDDLPTPGPAEDVDAFWSQIQGYVGAAYAMAAADPVCEGLFRDVARLHGQRGLPDAVRKLVALLEARTHRIVEEGCRLGAIRTDVPVALLTQMFISAGAAVDVYVAENTPNIRDAAPLVTTTMEMLQRMVAPPER